MNSKLVASELRKVASLLMGVEFPTKEAMDAYLKEHPKADRAKHHVKKQEENKPAEKPAGDKAIPEKKTESKAESKIGDIAKEYKNGDFEGIVNDHLDELLQLKTGEEFAAEFDSVALQGILDDVENEIGSTEEMIEMSGGDDDLEDLVRQLKDVREYATDALASGPLKPAINFNKKEDRKKFIEDYADELSQVEGSQFDLSVFDDVSMDDLKALSTDLKKMSEDNAGTPMANIYEQAAETIDIDVIENKKPAEKPAGEKPGAPAGEKSSPNSNSKVPDSFTSFLEDDPENGAYDWVADEGDDITSGKIDLSFVPEEHREKVLDSLDTLVSDNEIAGNGRDVKKLKNMIDGLNEKWSGNAKQKETQKPAGEKAPETKPAAPVKPAKITFESMVENGDPIHVTPEIAGQWTDEEKDEARDIIADFVDRDGFAGDLIGEKGEPDMDQWKKSVAKMRTTFKTLDMDSDKLENKIKEIEEDNGVSSKPAPATDAKPAGNAKQKETQKPAGEKAPETKPAAPDAEPTKVIKDKTGKEISIKFNGEHAEVSYKGDVGQPINKKVKIKNLDKESADDLIRSYQFNELMDDPSDFENKDLEQISDGIVRKVGALHGMIKNRHSTDADRAFAQSQVEKYNTIRDKITKHLKSSEAK